MRHWLRKLLRTSRMIASMFTAQMFGEYMHSSSNDECDYARYRWRGRQWIIPTSSAHED